MNNVVDTSAWLEYLAGTANGEKFASVIEEEKSVIMPTIVLFEIYKKLLTHFGEDEALLVIGTLKGGTTVIDLDEELAILAANLQKKYSIPMADSIILATAQFFNATLWTQDSDFLGIEGVRYFQKQR